MARKARARSRPVSRTVAGDPRRSVVDAFLRLAATHDIRDIKLADIAEEAGIDLGALRALFGGKLAILAEFSRNVDQAVLAKGAAEGETPRDRLFDVMMRRMDALSPHRDALRRLGRAAQRDPMLARGLHRITRRAMRWMLAAAGLERGGIIGSVTAEGLVLIYASVMRAFLDDTDPGLARTMAALDRGLGRAETWMGWVDRLCDLIPGFSGRDRPRSADAEL